MSGAQTNIVNRIQKTLEDANIKLASVATDIMGKSGRAMLDAMIEDRLTPEQMADLARARMRSKMPQLTEALTGRFTDHHRFRVRSLLAQIDHIDLQIESFDQRIDQVMSRFPSARHLASWAGICPGHDESAGNCCTTVIAAASTPVTTIRRRWIRWASSVR